MISKFFPFYSFVKEFFILVLCYIGVFSLFFSTGLLGVDLLLNPLLFDCSFLLSLVCFFCWFLFSYRFNSLEFIFILCRLLVSYLVLIIFFVAVAKFYLSPQPLLLLPFFLRWFLGFFFIVYFLLLAVELHVRQFNIFEVCLFLFFLFWVFLFLLEATNFLVIFLCMELITMGVVLLLSLYFIFFGANIVRPVLQFFVINVVVSAFYLLGLAIYSLLIPLSSSENLIVFSFKLSYWLLDAALLWDHILLCSVFKVILLFLVVPFLFKLTLAPFSVWVVSIYSYLPFLVLLVLMTIYKLVYFLVFLKLFLHIIAYVSGFEFSFSTIIYIFVIPSMFMGCFSYQNTDLKAILAFTTVSQFGYVVSAVVTLNFKVIQLGLLYLLVYCFLVCALFVCFILVQRRFRVSSIIHLAFIKYYSFPLYYAVCFLIFSLGGFPPFSLFVLKFLLFQELFINNYVFFALAGLFSSYLMSLVYLQLIVLCVLNSSTMFLFRGSNKYPLYRSLYVFEYVLLFFVVFICFCSTLFLFIYPFLFHLVGSFIFFGVFSGESFFLKDEFLNFFTSVPFFDYALDKYCGVTFGSTNGGVIYLPTKGQQDAINNNDLFTPRSKIRPYIDHKGIDLVSNAFFLSNDYGWSQEEIDFFRDPTRPRHMLEPEILWDAPGVLPNSRDPKVLEKMFNLK